MFKNIVKSALIGASLLAMAGTATAATYEINIFGASAQYKYWTAAAPEFLKKANGLNCATVYTAGSGSNGIAICPGTPGITTAGGVLTGTGANGDNNNYIIRYTSRSSIDGIRSVQDQNPDGVDGGCNNNPGQRLMGNPGTSTFAVYTLGGTPATTGAVTACTDVNVGVSDVEPATFNQESHGWLNYNATTPGSEVDRYAQGATMGSGYTHQTNLVIPFAFIKNPNVTVTSNVTRSMAGLIFSGGVDAWQDLFGGTGETIIDVCMRHAGSGTHATLDAAVLRADYNLVVAGEPYTSNIWFNESSGKVSDNTGMAGCVEAKSNAIGYADADISRGTPETINLMTYQGVAATKANVVSGLYDFWSYQHGYYKNSETAKARIDQMFEWSKSAANMPSALASFWVAEAEMTVYKANDFSMPQKK